MDNANTNTPFVFVVVRGTKRHYFGRDAFAAALDNARTWARLEDDVKLVKSYGNRGGEVRMRVWNKGTETKIVG